MPEFKEWRINDLAMSLNAIPLDGGGYAEDEVMTVEWVDADWWKIQRGADPGSITRYFDGDFSAIIGLKYAQSANANDRLTALLKADIALPNGGGAGVFMARDLRGRLVITGPRAWVIGPPTDMKFGKGVNAFNWRICVADASSSFFGGR